MSSLGMKRILGLVGLPSAAIKGWSSRSAAAVGSMTSLNRVANRQLGAGCWRDASLLLACRWRVASVLFHTNSIQTPYKFHTSSIQIPYKLGSFCPSAPTLRRRNHRTGCFAQVPPAFQLHPEANKDALPNQLHAVLLDILPMLSEVDPGDVAHPSRRRGQLLQPGTVGTPRDAPVARPRAPDRDPNARDPGNHHDQGYPTASIADGEPLKNPFPAVGRWRRWHLQRLLLVPEAGGVDPDKIPL